MNVDFREYNSGSAQKMGYFRKNGGGGGGCSPGPATVLLYNWPFFSCFKTVNCSLVQNLSICK